jgi:hypothetical protein
MGVDYINTNKNTYLSTTYKHFYCNDMLEEGEKKNKRGRKRGKKGRRS